MAEESLVHFVLNLMGHEVVHFAFEHAEFADEARRNVHAGRRRQKEYGLLVAKSSVYDPHCEF